MPSPDAKRHPEAVARRLAGERAWDKIEPSHLRLLFLPWRSFLERGTSSFLERDKEYLQTDLGIVLRFETRLHDDSMAVEFT